MVNSNFTQENSLANIQESLMPVSAIYYDKFEVQSLVHVASHRTTVIEVATFLKLSSIFNVSNGLDALAIDSLKNNNRFTVIYNLQSIIFNIGFRIITKLSESQVLTSLQSIFPGFDWVEREIWDLSGIFFIKHPDLRRILTDYGFSGHPLRKDFPVSGFKEVQYTDLEKQIIYKDLELSQRYRLLGQPVIWKNEETR